MGVLNEKRCKPLLYTYIKPIMVVNLYNQNMFYSVLHPAD